jgi:uncharacterized protein YecT (DUF1311 family)
MNGRHGDNSNHIRRTQDRLHDLQLFRDLRIINECTRRELGPLPPGGLPVEVKHKPNIPRIRLPHGAAGKEDDTMRVSHAAAAAAVIGVASALTACTQSDDPQPIANAAAQHIQNLSDDRLEVSSNEDASDTDNHRNPSVQVEGHDPIPPGYETEKQQMRSSYFACLDTSNGATRAIQECISEEWEYQDSRMNTAYRGLRQQLSQQKWLELRDEQREWLSNFESGKDCDWDSEERGQAHRIVANECSLRALTVRATTLEMLLTMK